jgi:hypothetical protein
LYLEQSAQGTGVLSGDYDSWTIGLLDGETLEAGRDYDIGEPSVTIHVVFRLDTSRNLNYPIRGELDISTEDLLETAVASIQIGTQFTQGDEEVLFPSDPFPIRLGYDADEGGGGCAVPGPGVLAFLLPLAPLMFASVKRRKSSAR